VRWRVEHLDSVDSTNARVAQRCRDGATEGLVLVSDYQSAGRGRRDRGWRAPPGSSLLCSALLSAPPSLAPQWIVVAAAMAMSDALGSLTLIRPELKWPNDILYADRKVAGVLAEALTTSATHVVVGVGVNLTAVDPDVTSATSVLAATGTALVADQLLEEYLSCLARRRAALSTPHGVAALGEEYRLALSTLGRRVRVELTADHVTGTAVGVDDDGSLRVDTGEGVRSFRAGDVVHLRREGEQ